MDKENGGHGSCINAGIQNAIGKYFKLVDADDYLDPGALKAHIDLLKKTDCDMIICDYCQFFSDNTINQVSYESRLTQGEYTKESLTDALHIDFSMYSYAHMHSITYKTKLLVENNIRITTKSFYVDQEYISYPFPFVNSIIYQAVKLYYYRLGRPGQSVDPAVVKKRIDMNYNILKNLIRYYETVVSDQTATRKYLLNIIYHHSWFYLTYTEDSEKFTEIMKWWQNNSDEYRKLLHREFSSSLWSRNTISKTKTWLKNHMPLLVRISKKLLK